MMRDGKRYFRKFLTIFIVVFMCYCLGVALFVVITDPFYQYHAPRFGMPVIMEDAVYQTPGAAKNLEYTDVLMGTSMTENFHTGWFDEELGWHTMKLSYSGARSNDLKAIFTAIFSRQEPVEHIFMDLNDYQLTEISWTAYVVRPEYLYDDCVLNDYKYVYNRDVIARGWERVLDAVWGVPDNIDSAYTWEDSELFGREITLNTAVDTRAQLLQNRTEGEDENRDEKIVTCQENLDNILPFIEENPDTEFIVFLPPYSMLYWEQLVLKGELEDMLEVYRYAMKQLLQYDNVSVYYFQNEKNIITNLDNYRDTCHHRPEYNRYIFEAVRDGKNRVTEENLGQTIEDMYEFAVDFDYNSYWE